MAVVPTTSNQKTGRMLIQRPHGQLYKARPTQTDGPSLWYSLSASARVCPCARGRAPPGCGRLVLKGSSRAESGGCRHGITNGTVHTGRERVRNQPVGKPGWAAAF